MAWGKFADELSVDLAFWYQGLDNPNYPAHQLGDLCDELSTKFRALGIMVLLAEANSDLFLHSLMRSAQVRIAYYEAMHRHGMTDDFFMSAGHYQPVLDALASGDVGLVHHIAALSPQDIRPGEYPDDHYHAQILFRLASNTVPTTSDFTPLLDAYANEVASFCPRLSLLRSLIARDQSEFDTAFSEFIDEVDTAIAKDIERSQHETPVVLAQRAVSVEGLAMLRLATKQGLTTERETLYCPSLARTPLTRPLPQMPS